MNGKNVRTATLPALSAAVVLFLLPAFTGAQLAETLTSNHFFFGNPFNLSPPSYFNFLGDATVNQGAIQLTPDTANDAEYYLKNRSGRALYSQPFRLWSKGSGGVRRASFQTSFDINMFRDPNQTAGEGMAFVIVPDAHVLPLNSWGGFLGLTNATIDGKATNQLVAIEFDTFKQPLYDPDDNHVGLNINSVRSTNTSSVAGFNLTASPLYQTKSLDELNLSLAPVNFSVYRVWVEYDGPNTHVNVYIAPKKTPEPSVPKPTVPILSANLDLSEHVAANSYLGFAASTGNYYELNVVLSWNISVDVLPEDDDQSRTLPEDDGQSRTRRRFLGIALPPVAAVILVIGLTVVAVHIWRRRVGDDEHMTGKLRTLPGVPREFRYKDLKKATGNFDPKNKLGQGGFGVVYRGVLAHGDNTPVAVKKFSRETMHGDFLAELTIISRLRHKHLVPLLGWSRKSGKLLLVYEYMPNGSLDAYLFGPASPGSTLPWEQRYTILRGVASALQYLHNEYDQKVVHRDLKASNIMLDADFNARLGDFGLARAIDDGRTSYADADLEGVPGTLGYIAPECFFTGKATRESDVFAFGAVVLEVVCARRPLCNVDGFRFLADWVWKLHREGRLWDAVDPRLGDVGGYVEEDAERLLLLGLACSHPIPVERPMMDTVVQIISRSTHPPQVPPFKPPLVLPEAGSEEDDGLTSSLTVRTRRSRHTFPIVVADEYRRSPDLKELKTGPL